MNQILSTRRLCPLLSGLSITERICQLEVPRIAIVPCRNYRPYYKKHWKQEYRKLRSRKMWKVDLPDFDKMRMDNSNLSPEEVRAKFKEKGVAPPNSYDERELFNPCTIGLIEQYKPALGDGKSSSLIDKVKSPVISGKDFVQGRRHLNVIKSFEGDDFSLEEFAKQSTEIYIKAHEALANKDDKGIFNYVTEHCFPLMASGVNRHTIIWKYLGDVEPPQTVLVRAADLISKGNKYAQITTRMYTKQILAVYDRHGRLAHGSPTDVKEVLEYIVFEKYLSDEYGSWRIHDRIRPEETYKPISQIVPKTYVKAETAG